ncbi:L,D-transpeptidase [Pseudovibrio sp. Tun.PSC04-5.I4]|uniref:L,D-transpeptidase n=1 Tax=Pseudovibrio sp. Tun.PSC04-5.I4 TaxID=1798213 RepID=UPI00089008BF|nr:L,D-transpeptidase [Pseudovibrio sp. Tun.PSC04-5.I4]SDR28687.1 L,D-transpeptidase catalytic domain [Pseudovibrio sp. Tun.PSC04-5.I4]
MRSLITISGLLFIALLLVLPAKAAGKKVLAKIDISEQTMRIFVNGKVRHSWPVSTARRGYRTPIGTFKPTRMHKRYFSRKYNGAPMPYSVFFYKGYAIHGTNVIKRLGVPASHGCVRLHPSNAKRLFSLIKASGAANAKIVIVK